MKMQNYFKKILFLTLIIFLNLSRSQEPASNFKGVIFGDYYYKMNGDSTGTSTQYSGISKNHQAFELRRFNLSYSNNLSETFILNFLIEGNEGSLDSKNRMGVFVKNAFVEWKNIFGNHNLSIGLVPTATWAWGISERNWGFRSLEKSSPDLRGIGNPAEFGISLRGKLFEQWNTNYVAMIANGSGLTSEKNRQKKVFLAVNTTPITGLITEIYTDYEGVTSTLSNYVIKTVIGYQVDNIGVGIDYFKRTNEISETKKIIPVSTSVYGKYKLPTETNLTFVGRYDMYDPDTEITNSGFTETMMIFGLDYAPNKNVHYIPNIWLVSYKAKEGEIKTRENNLVARLTFQFNF